MKLENNNIRLKEANLLSQIEANKEKIRILNEILSLKLEVLNTTYELKEKEMKLGENVCLNPVL